MLSQHFAASNVHLCRLKFYICTLRQLSYLRIIKSNISIVKKEGRELSITAAWNILLRQHILCQYKRLHDIVSCYPSIAIKSLCLMRMCWYCIKIILVYLPRDDTIHQTCVHPIFLLHQTLKIDLRKFDIFLKDHSKIKRTFLPFSLLCISFTKYSLTKHDILALNPYLVNRKLITCLYFVHV